MLRWHADVAALPQVRAVDSEHGKNLASDVWRKMQLYRSALANPSHPWARFATGGAQAVADCGCAAAAARKYSRKQTVLC